MIAAKSAAWWLESHRTLVDQIRCSPYSPTLHADLAAVYTHLNYPDLAVGSAYKALLLWDALRDESDEYHVNAADAVKGVFENLQAHSSKDEIASSIAHVVPLPPISSLDTQEQFVLRYEHNTYCLLIHCLLLTNCLKTAHDYYKIASSRWPSDQYLQDSLTKIQKEVAKHCNTLSKDDESVAVARDPNQWPNSGYVRREKYSWNNLEPARFEVLDEINALMLEVAPSLEVRAVDLPLLNKPDGHQETTRQLGVFAKEDLEPGSIVLNESSILTANNRFREALCEACSADLPELGQDNSGEVETCPDCDAVFCSAECSQAAQELYHSALCEKDVESIAKDGPPSEAPESLYALLLLRSFAMAVTQETHPLSLNQARFLWGDFSPQPPMEDWPLGMKCTHAKNTYESMTRTLPFSFKFNVQLPFHMLEKMDIDVFQEEFAEVWVFNTLYAKFRGTASARLSGLSGPIRGPEVSAVHPMWCMANHSCDPNVTWDWKANIQLQVKEERVQWHGGDEKKQVCQPGIKKDEEILNHYTDINMSVWDRREWAKGSLGGDCQCDRCLWESSLSKRPD